MASPQTILLASSCLSRRLCVDPCLVACILSVVQLHCLLGIRHNGSCKKTDPGGCKR